MKAEVAIALGAFVVSIISLIVTIIFAVKQFNLGKDTERLTEKLSQDEATVESRRFFSILWDKYVLLDAIDPKAPIEPDVRKVINTFQLIALCWQANVVDKEMVVIAFGSDFNLLCSQIEQAGTVPGTGRTGAELLNEHPAIMKVRGEINQRRNALGSMSS